MSKTRMYARMGVVVTALLTSGVTSSASDARTSVRDQTLGALGDLVGLPGAVLGRALAIREVPDVAEPGYPEAYDACAVTRRPVFDFEGNFRGYRLASPC